LRKVLGPERGRQRGCINFHAQNLLTFISNRIVRETAMFLNPTSSNWYSRVAVQLG